jgi:hypothetical protein
MLSDGDSLGANIFRMTDTATPLNFDAVEIINAFCNEKLSKLVLGLAKRQLIS